MSFRSSRAHNSIRHTILTSHPVWLKRFVDAMALGRKPLPIQTITVEDVTPVDREGGWMCLTRGEALRGDGNDSAVNAETIAANMAYPLRVRDGDTIIGYLVAGEARGEDLWGLVVPLHAGESESDADFQQRVRGAKQLHGVTPVS